MSTRDRRHPHWLVCYDGDAAAPPVPLDARDLQAAWRRAEREALGAAFALYDPGGRRARVGVAPPAALASPLPSTAVALTADGELVVTGHDRGVVRAHDARSGAVRWERATGTSRVDRVLVPARGRWVAACDRAGEVWVLARDTGATLLHLANDDARAIAASPDGAHLAVAGAVVELWSLPDGGRVATFDDDVALAGCARAGEDARGGGGGDDAPDDEDDEGGVYLVEFAAEGRVVGGRARAGGELVAWDRALAGRAAVCEASPMSRLAVARDGRRAVLAARDEPSSLRVIDLATLATQAVVATGAEGLRDLRVTPDGAAALLHDDATGVFVIDLATGATRAWLDELEACAYAVGGARAGRSRTPVLEDSTHVVALPRWRGGEPGRPLSSDGRRYAALRAGPGEAFVALFDVAACQPYAALAHARPVSAVWLDARGDRVVTRDGAGRVFVWPVPDAPARLPRAAIA